jgi:AcrR family transcriptional regulator
MGTVSGMAVDAGPPPADPRGSTGRGEATKQRIVDSAMRLFEEHGYQRTTMRAVAADAGVSLGNAYYYFASKEHLVQGYYDRVQDLHRDAALAALATLPPQQADDVVARLLAVEHAFLDVAAPQHAFASKIFAAAADPRSPLSPFSRESTPARQASTALFATAIEGSDLAVDKVLRPRLPELLWLAHMGVVLRWVHDLSPEQRHTRALVDRAVPLGVRTLRLTRFRPVRPVVRELLELLDNPP